MDPMKCPACSMETPEDQGYCDFCKEPFRKKAPPEPASAPKQPSVPVPPEVMEKVLAHKNAPGPSGSPYSPDIPPEFAEMGDGERIAGLPPAAKQLAWAFLALILLWTAVGMGWFLVKARRMEGRPSKGAILPPHEAIPQAPMTAPDGSALEPQPQPVPPPDQGFSDGPPPPPQG